MNPSVAAKLINDLIKQHLPRTGWSWTWSNARTQFGLCCYNPQVIKMSKPLVLINDEDIVRQVVLHEIAHVFAGPNANHGPVWRAHARALGVPPTPCTPGAKGIKGKVLGTCELGCGYEYRQHRITHFTYTRTICPNCSDKPRRQYVYLDWTRDGQEIPCPPKPRARRRRYYR